MGEWGIHNADHAPGADNFCGTQACAMGWAALSPEFNAEGLTASWSLDERTRSRWELDVVLDGKLHYWPDEAGCVFFGLSEGEAGDLFYGMGRTKPEVIARLRTLAVDREELRS